MARISLLKPLWGVLMKKAIIIGASSGIGRELTRLLANNGFEMGIAARRL